MRHQVDKLTSPRQRPRTKRAEHAGRSHDASAAPSRDRARRQDPFQAETPTSPRNASKPRIASAAGLVGGDDQHGRHRDAAEHGRRAQPARDRRHRAGWFRQRPAAAHGACASGRCRRPHRSPMPERPNTMLPPSRSAHRRRGRSRRAAARRGRTGWSPAVARRAPAVLDASFTSMASGRRSSGRLFRPPPWSPRARPCPTETRARSGRRRRCRRRC